MDYRPIANFRFFNMEATSQVSPKNLIVFHSHRLLLCIRWSSFMMTLQPMLDFKMTAVAVFDLVKPLLYVSAQKLLLSFPQNLTLIRSLDQKLSQFEPLSFKLENSCSWGNFPYWDTVTPNPSFLVRYRKGTSSRQDSSFEPWTVLTEKTFGLCRLLSKKLSWSIRRKDLEGWEVTL